MNYEPGEVTELLHRWRTGDREVENRLFELVQPGLHRLAECYMRRERPGHILQPTTLLSELYIKLSGAKDHVDWRDRGHFFALAARAMRRLLIDHARGRGNEVPIAIEALAERVVPDVSRLDLAIAVDLLLDELAKQNQEQCYMVELKFFLGLTDEEAADALQLPLRTAQRRWLEARTWLYERLEAQGWKTQQSKTTTAS